MPEFYDLNALSGEPAKMKWHDEEYEIHAITIEEWAEVEAKKEAKLCEIEQLGDEITPRRKTALRQDAAEEYNRELVKLTVPGLPTDRLSMMEYEVVKAIVVKHLRGELGDPFLEERAELEILKGLLAKVTGKPTRPPQEQSSVT